MAFTVARNLVLLCAVVLGSTAATSADALVINNYFSSYLRSNPKADQIMAAINYSSRAFEALLANDVTVNIRYDIDTSAYNFLGLSGYSSGGVRKDYYAEMLQNNAAAHPENKVLAQAIKDLGQGNYGNPDLTRVSASSALMRANGIPIEGDFDTFINEDGTPVFDLGGDTLKGGGLDGVVTLASIDEMVFGFDIPAYDGTPGSEYYPAINTLQHEIMHVLGGGNSNIGSPDQMESLDMYRYSAPGVANFGEPGRAYFSVDGGRTEIQQFYDGTKPGDYNGWGPVAECPVGGPGRAGPVGLFMSSISCSNQPVVTFSLGSPEGIELLALGWNPRVAAVPEPATWALMLVGFAGVGAALRRRRAIAAAA